MLRGQDLVMNPGAEYGKILTAGEVESIINGSIFHPQGQLDVGGKQMLLGQPQDYPLHITEALSKYFARSRGVQTAYLAHAMIPDIDQAPHTLIGIVVRGDWRTMIEGAGLVVREVAKPDEVVDFVELRPQSPDPILNYMLRETKPFYVRQKWLGIF